MRITTRNVSKTLQRKRASIVTVIQNDCAARDANWAFKWGMTVLKSNPMAQSHDPSPKTAAGLGCVRIIRTVQECTSDSGQIVRLVNEGLVDR